MLKLSSDSENKYHKTINPAVILIPEKSLFILKRNDPHKIQCMHIKMDMTVFPVSKTGYVKI